MKIDLTICGLKELADLSGEPWTHVVSIWDKDSIYDPVCRELVDTAAPGAQVLFCFFADTSVPDHPEAPGVLDVKRILNFTSELTAKDKVLVHCRAGVSRSTAIAYAILCQHSSPGEEMENLLHVQTLRPLVFPNRLIIKLADKVLNRNGGMILHLSHED